MSWEYDGFNLSDGVTYLIDPVSDPFNPPPFEVTTAPYATRAGAVLTARPPVANTVSLAGVIIGNVNTGAWGSARDALVAALSRPGRRLRANFTGDAFAIATPHNIKTQPKGIGWGTWTADFVISDPYFQAATPSTDVRTPTLTAAIATQYRTTISVAPGGTAPAPLKMIVANLTGGVTPSRFLLSNLQTGERITTEATVAAGGVLVFDPDSLSYPVIASPMTNVTLYAPLWDASGNPKNFTDALHDDLTANGTILYQQDDPTWGVALDLDGSTGFLSTTEPLYIAGATAFTAGMWVRPDVANTPMGLIGKSGSGVAHAGWRILKTSANVFEASISDGATTRTATGTRTAVVGEPYFVTMSVDAGTITLMVNAEVEKVTGGGAFTIGGTVGDLRIGAPHDAGGTARFWDGHIGTPFVVLGTAYTQEQVRTAMRHGVPKVSGTGAIAPGHWPIHLDPAAGATNVLELRAEHATTAPTLRLGSLYRARYA